MTDDAMTISRRDLLIREAALDLYAACQGALEEFREWEGPEEDEVPGPSLSAAQARNKTVRAYEAIRAAIAKAEGR